MRKLRRTSSPARTARGTVVSSTLYGGPPGAAIGMRSIPHSGHLRAPAARTSGCIGHPKEIAACALGTAEEGSGLGAGAGPGTEPPPPLDPEEPSRPAWTEPAALATIAIITRTGIATPMTSLVHSGGVTDPMPGGSTTRAVNALLAQGIAVVFMRQVS